MILNGVQLEMMAIISGIHIFMKAIPHGYFYCQVSIKLIIQMSIIN